MADDIAQDGFSGFLIYRATRIGKRRTRRLTFDAKKGTIIVSSLDPTPTTTVFELTTVSRAEKSASDPSAMTLIFVGAEDYSFNFYQATARDEFCLLILLLRPAIEVVENCEVKLSKARWMYDVSLRAHAGASKSRKLVLDMASGVLERWRYGKSVGTNLVELSRAHKVSAEWEVVISGQCKVRLSPCTCVASPRPFTHRSHMMVFTMRGCMHPSHAICAFHSLWIRLARNHLSDQHHSGAFPSSPPSLHFQQQRGSTGTQNHVSSSLSV